MQFYSHNFISSKLGATTMRAIGPTYATKALRYGIRLADLMGDFGEFTKRLVFK
jgi:adenylosuccinate synthase